MILEATIDGEDMFVFRDGKVFLEHKNYKMPTNITVNGKPWTELDKPFELGFTPDPAKTRFVCEGRGTWALLRFDETEFAVSVDDDDGGAARYKITLFQPSGDKKTDGN